MLDYLILTLEIPKRCGAKISAWCFARSCQGLERDEEGELCRLRVYFESDRWLPEHREALRRDFPELLRLDSTPIRLPAPDPAAEIREVRLEGELFRLRAAPAFGSGGHPTTRLTAEALVSLRPETRVLDVGTGTGILALLARRRGALRIDAVEISPEARENALQNFALNSAEGIRLHSDLHEAAEGYDLILANVLTPTLVHLADELIRRLAPAGLLSLSGILEAERDLIRESYAAMEFLGESREGDWLGMRFRKG